MSEDEEIKTGHIMLSASRSKLDYQLNADNGFDSKAGVILAFEGAFAAFYLGIIQNCMTIINIIPLVLLLISVIFLWKILTSKEYATGVVDFFNDSKEYRLMSENKLLLQILSDYQQAFDDNNKILGKKNEDYKWALTLFVGSVILIVIFYIF